eukprot:TRINITY_DN5426_c0_g1_i2.p1 TRINITY_DN5426_c0_g1~~TRINITY_DN5426_c0_g1_i2.p1  ORF type:complete len:519 (-),score=135.09 TRINITY_DN5426_c0_g1_i2:188-1744(-)
MSASASIVDMLLAGGNAMHNFPKGVQRTKPLNPGLVAASGSPSGHRSPNGPAGRQAAKLFIGGISRHTTTKQLRDHFMKYGRVIDCVAMKEADGRSRGFGYVTFSSQAACDRVLSEPQNIDGRIVDVKRAVPEGTGGESHMMESGLSSSELAMPGLESIYMHNYMADLASPWSWSDFPMGASGIDDFALGAMGFGGRTPDCLELLSSGPLPPIPATRQYAQQQGSLVLGTTPVAAAAADSNTKAGKCMSAEAAEFVPSKEDEKPQALPSGASVRMPRKVLGEISTQNAANIQRSAADDDMSKKPMFIQLLQPVRDDAAGSLPLTVGALQSVSTSKLDILTTFDDDMSESNQEAEQEPERGDAAVAALGNLDVPSMGSLLHKTGNCKRCNFFAKGRCENGKEKRHREVQEGPQMFGATMAGLSIETEFDDDLVMSCLGAAQEDAFLHSRAAVASQPDSVRSAHGLGRLGTLSAPAAPPGLAAPEFVAAWRPEEELNPMMLAALADAMAQQVAAAAGPQL